MINGTSGGVGHYATQLANYLGAEVTGVSSAKNKAFVLANGAHHHADYTLPEQINALTGFDLVFDMVGNRSILEVAKPVANGGKVITIVNHNLLEEDVDDLKQQGIAASSLLVGSSGDDMALLARLLEQGILRSHVSQVFDFEHIGDAHLQLQTARTVGKLVIQVN